jgi:hypothetical protein
MQPQQYKPYSFYQLLRTVAPYCCLTAYTVMVAQQHC